MGAKDNPTMLTHVRNSLSDVNNKCNRTGLSRGVIKSLNVESTFTRIKYEDSGRQRCCTTASPKPAASVPTVVGVHTAIARPEDAHASGQAPGLHPRKPVPMSQLETEFPGRLKTR